MAGTSQGPTRRPTALLQEPQLQKHPTSPEEEGPQTVAHDSPTSLPLPESHAHLPLQEAAVSTALGLAWPWCPPLPSQSMSQA